jgi:hemerythrin-like domain-containing protein
LLQSIAQGHTAALDDAAEEFIRVYDDHIAVENSQLLPLAGRLLTPTQLEIMGRSFAARRGVNRTHR